MNSPTCHPTALLMFGHTCAVGMRSMPFVLLSNKQPITDASVCALLLPMIHQPPLSPAVYRFWLHPFSDAVYWDCFLLLDPSGLSRGCLR